jgi:hypothetical protein
VNNRELAVLTGRFGAAAMKVGDKIYRVKLRPKSTFPISVSPHIFHVEGLPIEFEIQENFWGCKVITTTSIVEDEHLAIVLMLHFAQIHKWRET